MFRGSELENGVLEETNGQQEHDAAELLCKYSHNRVGAHLLARRGMRLVLVCFALTAASIMLVTSFASAVEALVEQVGDATIVSPDSLTAGSGVPTQATERVLHDPMMGFKDLNRTQETRSIYTRNDPVVSSAISVAMDTLFADAPTAYNYTTTYGRYSFSKSDPTLLTLSNSAGELLASSWFGLESNVALKLGEPLVLKADESIFEVQQSVHWEGLAIGDLIARSEFNDKGRPKFTAILTDSPSDQYIYFSTTWNVELPSSSAVQCCDSLLDSEQLLLQPMAFDGVRSFEAGFLNDEAEWQSRCKVDWSDAIGGDVTWASTAKGLLAKVKFPKGATTIDPTLTATSSTPYATSGPPFRNIVFHSGDYFLFYHTGAYLAYVVSKDGGESWSASSMVPSSTYVVTEGGSFDVALAGDMVSVCWQDWHILHCVQGTIHGSAVDWECPISFPPFYNGIFGGIALGADGTAYISYVSWQGTDPKELHTFKKNRSDAQFTEFDNPFNSWSSVPAVAPRQVKLSNGNIAFMVVVVVNYPALRLDWNVYVPSLYIWKNGASQWMLDLEGADSYRDFSACPGESDDVNFVIKGAYSGSGLSYWRLVSTDSDPHYVHRHLSEGNLVMYPTISADSNNDVRVHYMQDGDVWERHTLPNELVWSEASRIFENSSDTPGFLSAGERLASRDFLSYTDQNPSPKQVMFCAIPLPVDSVGTYNDPWSRAGINQDQPFSVGLADTISPGNGLLYVSQTDFVVPGRGLDMVSSRFHSAPQYFVQDANGSYVPYLYERFPYCDMGQGWQLNMPWIDDTYLHLWGGSKYVIKWDGSYFNNTIGQTFSLAKFKWAYILDLPDGMRVKFSPLGVPTSIYSNTLVDDSNPDIQIAYNQVFGITRLTDYLGRRIYYNYSENGKLATIEYGGNSVTFSYSGDSLVGVTDALGQTTDYAYSSPPTPSILLRSISLPGHGMGPSIEFSYSTIQVGSEAIAYLVAERKNDLRSTKYFYTAVDGAIRYTEIDEYRRLPRYTLRGSTEYNFDSAARATIVTEFGLDSYPYGSELVPIKRTVSWYSPDGRISRTESYDDFTGPPDTTLSTTDNKGNMVYAMGPLGHETYASFANSSTRNAFVSPGLLRLDSSGKLFHDDFNDWILDGWIDDGIGSSTIGNWMADADRDPSLNISATTGIYKSGVRLNETGEELHELVVDFTIMMPSGGNWAQIRLEGESGVRQAELFLGAGLWNVWNGENYNVLDEEYVPDTAYRVTMVVSPGPVPGESSTFELYLNGSFRGEWTLDDISPSFLNVYVFSVGTQCIIVDDVKAFRNSTIRVEGLSVGDFVEIYGQSGSFVSRQKCAGTGTVHNIEVSASGFLPYGNLVVRNKTGVVETIDTYRGIWGGDVFTYSNPTIAKCAVNRGFSGFEVPRATIMDDSIPLEQYQLDGNFEWEDYADFVLSGQRYHHAGVVQGAYSHSYNAVQSPGVPQQPSVSRDSYLIQYVYLPPECCPAQIGLSYYYIDQQVGQWSKMAYWGVNATLDPASVCMGPLPSPGQWVMLIVEAEDIGWYTTRELLGVKFTQFNGDVYFDRSEIEMTWPTERVYVKFSGGSELFGKTLELRKPDGSLVESAVAYPNTILHPYDHGIRSYPMSGYFVLRDSTGNVFYESPVFKEMYPGDEYVNSPSSSPFFSNPPAPTGFRNLPLGSMQYLDWARQNSSEMYYRYGDWIDGGWKNTFLVNETKTRNGTTWLYTSYRYDSFGNVRQVIDDTGAKMNYSYVNEGTNLASAWIRCGSQNLSTNYAYYPSGLLMSETDALGRTTTYEYDSIGRITRVTYPQIGSTPTSVNYTYDDVERIEIFYDQNDTATKTYYDEFGRVTLVERLAKDGSVYSSRTYRYDWNEKVWDITDSSSKQVCFEYDYLGRTVEAWNPDGTCVRTTYDDRNRTVTSYDEMGNRTEALFDANDQLIRTTQYIGSRAIHTSLQYDAVGDLLAVIDCNGSRTLNEYDNLGRLVKTTLPYGGYQQFWYDDASRLLKKRTETGALITYKYDIAGRMLEWRASSTDYATFSYDANGNVLQAERVYGTASVTTTLNYDEWSRQTFESTKLDKLTRTVYYSYDNRSNVREVTVKSGISVLHKLSFDYDEFDRPLWVKDTKGSPVLLADFEYSPQDQITAIDYGNLARTTFTIDENRGWLSRVQTVRNGNNLVDIAYERDACGMIRTISGSRISVYDTVGRLTYANDTTTYGRFAFTYDDLGNRLTQTKNGAVTTYAYDSYGRLIRNTTNGMLTRYQYVNADTTGLLWKKIDPQYTWTFSYDAGDQLRSVKRGSSTVEEYTYDAFGRRVKSVESGTTEYTFYGPGGPIYTRKGSTDTFHAYVCGIHIAKKTGTSYYYYHMDGQGSVRLVTNSAGSAVFSSDYLPFGKPYNAQQTEDFKFLDARTTKSTGLVHFGARYYDPDLGRFTTADVVLGSLTKPSSLNRWAYCLNDPVNRVDLDGQWSLKGFVNSVCNAVKTVVTTAVSYVVETAVNLVGEVIEAVVDGVTAVAETVAAVVNTVIDAAEEFVEDVKEAAGDLLEAGLEVVSAVREAWDNLDPGLKQWIIAGVSMAVSFIPLVGPILACVVDGTFVDMINALKSGDWAMLGMCAMAFVPGMKGATSALKGLKAVGSFSGKGQTFIRYMGEKECKNVLKTKTVQSMTGRTYMTKNVFKDSDTMLGKLNKPNPSDKCFIEFRVKNDVQIHGANRVTSDTGKLTGAWEYWIEEGDHLSIDILSYGRLP